MCLEGECLRRLCTISGCGRAERDARPASGPVALFAGETGSQVTVSRDSIAKLVAPMARAAVVQPETFFVRSRTTAINPVALDSLSQLSKVYARIQDAPEPRRQLSFDLFTDAKFTGVIEQRDAMAGGDEAWTGRILGDQMGRLCSNGLAVASSEPFTFPAAASLSSCPIEIRSRFISARTRASSRANRRSYRPASLLRIQVRRIKTAMANSRRKRVPRRRMMDRCWTFSWRIPQRHERTLRPSGAAPRPTRNPSSAGSTRPFAWQTPRSRTAEFQRNSASSESSPLRIPNRPMAWERWRRYCRFSRVVTPSATFARRRRRRIW